MSDQAIEVQDLTKKFGKFTAVDHISFNVRHGEIFGFLGANGAGKSTTIRMLCGLLSSTSGRALVGGYDINKESEKVKMNIGYMSQRFSLYDDLTVEQNIRFYGGIYGLQNDKLEERMAWVLTMADLGGRERSLTKTLSGGWKQRLALGCAILHRPRIVFLDEPTGGVDPISRRNFWELINQLSDEGITVLVTTHFLDEAEYCNTIILINAGKLIATGTPSQLKSEYIANPILEVPCREVVEALDIVRAQAWVLEVTVFGTRLHVMVEDEKEGASKLAALLSSPKFGLGRIQRIAPSLEDVFLYLLDQDAKGAV
jgi:ABC-2 type transport system ATP-binding protein